MRIDIAPGQVHDYFGHGHPLVDKQVEPAGMPGPALGEARDVLENILAKLRRAPDLKAGEAALVAVSDLFHLPWVFWVPDTSYPYVLPEMICFARARGWPESLLELWLNRHVALKMPLYIRCRHEHLPFVISPNDYHDATHRVSPEQARVTTLIRNMGVTTILAVPVHLPKSQVGIIIWAGGARRSEIQKIVTELEGDLLAIGHRFMRIISRSLAKKSGTYDERSRLTLREWDCMRTLAQGYREAEIAEIMGISTNTTRFHFENVIRKFGCKTRLQAVALLAQLGLLGSIGK